MFQTLKSKIKESSIEEIQISQYMLQALIETVNNFDQLNQYLLELLSDACQQIYLLISILEQEILAYNQKQVADQTQQIDVPSAIFFGLHVLTTWMETYESIMDRITGCAQQIQESLLKQIIRNDILIAIFIKALGLIILTPKQLPNQIVSTTGIQEIDNELNKVKSIIIKKYIKINPKLHDPNSPDEVRLSIFKLNIPQILQVVVNSIISLSQNDAYFEYVDKDRFCLELFTNSINFISSCTPHYDYYHIINQVKELLIIHIILPKLTLTELEQDYIANQPDQFVNYAIDIIYEQKSDSCKTVSAKLLECLCQHIDGSTSAVVATILELIRFSFESNDINEIPTKYNYLKNITNCRILTKVDRDTRIETSLLILSILHLIIIKRPDIIKLVEKMLIQQQDQLFKNKSCNNVIQSRLCLLIGTLHSVLYQQTSSDNTSKKNQSYFIRFLLKKLKLKTKESRIIQLQAIDSLQNIFGDKDCLKLTNEDICAVVSNSAHFLRLSHNLTIFELLKDVLVNYSQTLVNYPDMLDGVIISLVEKINIELQKIEQSKQKKKNKTKKSKSIHIKQSWNLIRSIISIQEFGVLLERIQAHVFQLFNLLGAPHIDFSEDILLTMSELLNYMKKMDKFYLEIILKMKDLFASDNQNLGIMFPAINSALVYGQELLLESKNKPLLVMFLEMSILSFNNFSEEANDVDRSKGAVIIQLVLQFYNQVFTPQEYEEILSKVCQRLSQNMTDLLRIRLLEVILVGISLNYKLTSEILVKLQIEQDIYNLLVDKYSLFVSGYDFKMYFLGINSLIQIEDQLTPTAKERLPKLFQALVQIMHVQAKNQVELLQERQASQGVELEEKKADPDSSDDIYTENLMSENQQLDQEFTKKIHNPILMRDEYEMFRSTLLKLKSSNPENLQLIWNQLGHNNQDFLREIANIQKVSITDSVKVSRRLVKVKKSSSDAVTSSQPLNQAQLNAGIINEGQPQLATFPPQMNQLSEPSLHAPDVQLGAQQQQTYISPQVGTEMLAPNQITYAQVQIPTELQGSQQLSSPQFGQTSPNQNQIMDETLQQQLPH